MTPLLSSALLATQSDARLLTLAAAGHDRAFEAIVERYRRPLGRYLRRVLSGPLAEDVLQATFVNAWTSLRRGTEVRDLRPWLYRIAHNQAVNALSRAEPRLAVEHDADRLAATVAGPEAEVERRDTLKRALTAIAGLPDRQRAALVAVAVEDRSHPDVARELGLTEGALRQLVHRARTTLRAAATAVVPVPLVTAAVASGSDTTLGRVAEVAVGAGGAGLGVKTGAALLAAGAMVVAAPAVHEQRVHPGPAPAAARAAATPSHARAASVRVASAPAARPRARSPVQSPRPTAVDRRRERGQKGSAPSEDDHRGSDRRGGREAAPAVSDDNHGRGDDSRQPSTLAPESSGGRGSTSVESTGERGGRSGETEGSPSGSGDDGGSTEHARAPVQPEASGTAESSGPGSGDDVPSLP